MVKKWDNSLSLSASNWPNVVVVRLIVRVYVAVLQVDVPRVVRIVRVRTARPIVVRLDALKIRPLFSVKDNWLIELFRKDWTNF